MGERPENMDQHERMMMRALALAQIASGRVSPNPVVGCVVTDSTAAIIGEGWHEGPGTEHAEIMALKSAGVKAKGATAYVTLEPCNHTGRTGPCAEALLEAGVAKVVFAVADPNPLAAGGGDSLCAAGIEVVSGVCETQARYINRGWFRSVEMGRPYVIAKSAMSLDGRIATSSGESQWITGEEARAAGHALRAEADAVIVGAETVVNDDPALTARNGNEVQYPLRVVVDSTARTPIGAKVWERSGRGALLATTKSASQSRLVAFKEMGVEIAVLPDEDGRVSLSDLLDYLRERERVTLMVEGGGQLIGAFFDADLIDELHLFIAPKLIGGGKPAFGGTGVEVLADSNRFSFERLAEKDGDQHWRGLRRKEGA
ncbi:MAG: bifunctional diaminohydroxyphosphoribosylaminopyrimidine deaminase/5-amino-6-(5-phosphoribosylamino)uracil reductase RibD [Marinicaulis sp.]|nr:bifunctional diaminohydroxyphosphoribosylaminopyrimidine deaminase/5-amino-6-(5-phosphoribosylamino)uracil reductase RibD [Marinicaulis sp.]NNE40882.1 bifunctional diaminohydroxyphosphoribosylaminopyrimidine deaminase/5-amino-6-(5-phosphoribosylamino)uracil reductase RibD [Marinicaulis sp.]